MKDSFKHQGLRRKLVEELRAEGIKNEAVLAAIGAVPRHQFVDVTFESRAYENSALSIASQQTISQPTIVALQSEALDLTEGMKVLEIGTGSGYQAAVLGKMGVDLVTIERFENLHKTAKKRLAFLQMYNVQCVWGDGFMGYPEKAPYDRVLLTAAPEKIPMPLIEQLKVGGLLVAPIGMENEKQELVKITKLEVGWKEERIAWCRFVPMLEGKLKD